MAPRKEAGHEETLQTRIGLSDAVARLQKELLLSWKTLTPVDVPLLASVLPNAHHLTVLDLRHNKLGDQGVQKLSDAMRSSQSLRTLYLTRNGITDRGAASLATFLKDARVSGQLATLDLSLNAIRDDKALGDALTTNTGLTALDVSSNALRSGRAIAAALGHNRTLTHGHLLFNRLDVGSAAALAEALRKSRAAGVPLTLCGTPAEAEAIQLSRRGMRSSDAMLLAAELESAPTVRSVDLSYNMLGPEAAGALAAALMASSSLTTLNLQSNRLAGSWLDFGDEVGIRDDTGVITLAHALVHGNALTALNLSLNNLGEAGARALAEAAADAPLDDPLRWLHVGSAGEALPVQPLRGIAVRGEVHSSISLGGKRLDDLDAVVVSTLIATNGKLQVLDLSGSAVGAVGCAALARALACEGCLLTQLDLRGKAMLGEEGKLAIGAALLNPHSARVGCLACDAFALGPNTAALDLPGASLSDADISLLAGVLHHNDALLSLDLSNNKMGAAACSALCTAISRNEALIELDVYGNDLGDDGARMLSDALKNNQTLTALALGLNAMSAEGVRRVCHALESNPSLVALSLENNLASNFTEAHAEQLLASNRRRQACRKEIAKLGNGELVGQSRLHVHMCGESASGKTALAGALRRSGVGQKNTDVEGGVHERSRGVQEQVQRYESRTFVMTDYGGKTEFALMHHHHHDRNARSILAPAVYVVVINLLVGFEQGCAELRWWRRYIRALMPRGTVPPICLVGSRGDRVKDPNKLLGALREHANADGAELPEISSHFAFDCRGAAWPIREWYVSQFDNLVGSAPPVPRVIDAVLHRKYEWAEKHRGLRSLPWSEFAARLRREVAELKGADEYAFRAIGSYLHETSSLLLPDPTLRGDTNLAALSTILEVSEGYHEPVIILDVPWFYSCVVTDLIDAKLEGPPSYAPPHESSHAGGAMDGPPSQLEPSQQPSREASTNPARPPRLVAGAQSPPPIPGSDADLEEYDDQPSELLITAASAFAAAAADAADAADTTDGMDEPAVEEAIDEAVDVTDAAAAASLPQSNAPSAAPSKRSRPGSVMSNAPTASAARSRPGSAVSNAPTATASVAVSRAGSVAASRAGSAAASAANSVRSSAAAPSAAPTHVPAPIQVPDPNSGRIGGSSDGVSPSPSSPTPASQSHHTAFGGLPATAPTRTSPPRERPRPATIVPSVSAAQLASRCRCAAILGDDAGVKLALVLCELGICAPLAAPDALDLEDDGFPPSERVSYLLPPPLSHRAFDVGSQVAHAAAALRNNLSPQAARRFVGRSADDALLVPSLLTRLHSRASQEPPALDEPESRFILRDGEGQLLLARCGACVLLQLCELPDGRDAVDVFACATRPSALVYVMLGDALELLRLCVSECAPGSQTEHHVIGASGLDDHAPPGSRPTAPIGVVRAACKAKKATVLFGGHQQSVVRLLGDEEVRSTHALAAAAAVKPLGARSPPSQSQANKPMAAQKPVPTAVPLAEAAPNKAPPKAPSPQTVSSGAPVAKPAKGGAKKVAGKK